MAKKENKLNPIFGKANLSDARWINTPFAYTEFFSGLSLLQQDVMFKVSDSIQGFFKNYFGDGRHLTKDVPRPLFTEEEKKTLQPIRVVLAEYGITTNNYDTLEKAVKEILSLQVRVPGINKDGDNVLKWVNIFLEGEAAFTKDGYTFVNKEGELTTTLRSKGYLDFKINPDVADYVFDMSKGYITHPNTIARISTVNHTPLLLGLLQHKCGRTGKCRLTVNEIKNHLGLFYHQRDVNGDKVITSYMLPKYSQFEKLVLLKVQKDLERLADDNQIDYTYTFTKIMPPGRKTGDPKFIEFELVRTKLGDLRDMAKHRKSANKKLLETLLSRCGDLEKAVVMPIVLSVDDSDFADFSTYCYRDMPRIIEKNYPENVAAYMLAMMRNWIKDRVKSKQEHKQQDLFDAPCPVSSEHKALWEKIWDDLNAENAGIDIYKEAVELIEVTDKKVIMQIPTKTTLEIFTNKYGRVLWDRVGEVFAREVEITIKN